MKKDYLQMMKCYILGAGASFGYDDNIPYELRPPLTCEFFIKGHQLGIFTEKSFPDLFNSVKEFLEINGDIQDKQQLECDIEKLLDWLANEFYKTTPSSEVDFSRTNYLQRALSQTFYFIYELFRHYTLSYTPKFDNYRRLALHYHTCKYSITTLNYDILFELAAQSVNLNTHYFPGPHYPKSIPIAKIHGSINWLNPCKGGIAFGGLGSDAFSEIITPIFSNRIHMGSMMVLPLTAIRDIGYRDFVRSGVDYDEPAIVPPLAGYKDYDKIKDYSNIWTFAESMLRETTELVIIGCSIRPEDAKFNGLLQKVISEKASITVVDKSPDKIIDNIKKIVMNPIINKTFISFTDYAKTL
jgi:hypothetical protein